MGRRKTAEREQERRVGKHGTFQLVNTLKTETTLREDVNATLIEKQVLFTCLTAMVTIS